jgi:putative endonuclease
MPGRWRCAAAMTARRVAAEQAGRKGEALAAEWLTRQGWEVLGSRLRAGVGEVDLVVRREQVVAFVEVKWRARGDELAFAIDERRLSRVAAAAEVLAPRFVGADDDMRIDVLLIAPGRPPRHIVNAWQPYG